MIALIFGAGRFFRGLPHLAPPGLLGRRNPSPVLTSNGWSNDTDAPMKISTSIRLCLPAAVLAALTSFPAHSQPRRPHPPRRPLPPRRRPLQACHLYPVTVVDKKGDPVKNLTAADVTLTDNGHIQTIQSFLPASPAPSPSGCWRQTSTNLRGELGDERLASVSLRGSHPARNRRQILRHPVRPRGRSAGRSHRDGKQAPRLHHAARVAPVRQSEQQQRQQRSELRRFSRHRGGGGTLYDAIYLASNEILKKQPGQHVIVLITDGIDRDSKETVNDAIEAAQAAHAAIFAIYYKGEEERTNNPNQNNGRRGGTGGSGYPGVVGLSRWRRGYPGGGGGGGRRGGQAPSEQPHVDGKEILEHICSATGGYMVEGKRDKADESFAKLTALLKNQYTLSWTPDKDAANSVSHHLTLTTKKAEIWPLVQQDYSTTQ